MYRGLKCDVCALIAGSILLLMIFTGFMPIVVSEAQSNTAYLKHVARYHYRPLISWPPHGKLNLLVDIYKVKADGSATFDWYLYRIRMQVVPGWLEYGSFWRTADVFAYHKVYNPGAYRWLVDYQPTTTYGTSTTEVAVSFQISWPPGLAIGVSWSYSIPDVVVRDCGDLVDHVAYWWHDVDEKKGVGAYTLLLEPGFVVMTQQDHWSYIDARYGVQFWDWFTDLLSGIRWSSWLYLDARDPGD